MTSQDPDPTQTTPITPSMPAAGDRAPASPPPFTPPPHAAPPSTPPPAPPPAWQPPPADYGRNGALVFGVILVLIGLWFFASTTLGLDLPDLDWGVLWPLLLIGLGAWIVLGAMGRRR